MKCVVWLWFGHKLALTLGFVGSLFEVYDCCTSTEINFKPHCYVPCYYTSTITNWSVRLHLQILFLLVIYYYCSVLQSLLLDFIIKCVVKNYKSGKYIALPQGQRRTIQNVLKHSLVLKYWGGRKYCPEERVNGSPWWNKLPHWFSAIVVGALRHVCFICAKTTWINIANT